MFQDKSHRLTRAVRGQRIAPTRVAAALLRACQITFAAGCALFSTLPSEAMNATGASTLNFVATGPAGLAINGDGGAISVEETADALTLKTSMLALKTGIELRDEHLKKYIGAKEYPTATLAFEKSKVPHPANGKASEGTLRASLTFHGKTKPVNVAYKVDKNDAGLKVQGRFEFDLPEYGVDPPCYLGVCVDKHVKVKAKLNVTEN